MQAEQSPLNGGSNERLRRLGRLGEQLGEQPGERLDKRPNRQLGEQPGKHPDKQPPLNTVQGFYFNTINRISGYCNKALLVDALNLCAWYERLLSKTIAGSDVWNLNHAGGKSVVVHQHTKNIIITALEIAQASGGALNIALQPAIALWKLAEKAGRLPNRQLLDDALRFCNLNDIVIKKDCITMPKTTQIDLGGIAKGYIANRIADSLRENGVGQALLNFGGNVVTIGTRWDNSPWRIGLQTPTGIRENDYFAVVESSNNSVVTSGVYERGYTIDGKPYHHILDPKTGYPANTGIVSQTVVAKDSCLADALATALLVRGIKDDPLVQKYNVQVASHYDDGSINFTTGLPVKFVG